MISIAVSCRMDRNFAWTHVKHVLYWIPEKSYLSFKTKNVNWALFFYLFFSAARLVTSCKNIWCLLYLSVIYKVKIKNKCKWKLVNSLDWWCTLILIEKENQWAKDKHNRILHCFGLKSVFLNLQCSAECGIGVRTRAVLCLTNQVSSLPLEGCGSERPATSQVCNNGHCEQRIEWFTGPWSQVRGGCRVTLGSRGCSLDQMAMWNITVNLHGLIRICLTFFLHWLINSMRPVRLSALQSVAQAASRGQWCAWWGRTRASLSCSPTSARPWSGRSASRAATWRPAEQSGTTPTGVG